MPINLRSLIGHIVEHRFTTGTALWGIVLAAAVAMLRPTRHGPLNSMANRAHVASSSHRNVQP